MQPNTPQITRKSYGIFLYKPTPQGIHALAVRRRVTYDFYDFIIHPSRDTRHLINQLNNMSCDEKMDLLSLDFSRIYYRLWGTDYTRLNVDNKKRYITYRDMFIRRYKADNGRLIRHLVQNSKSVEAIWEIPKGRKTSGAEGNLNCAIREFAEETGVTPDKYIITDTVPTCVVHYSNGVRYENYYYKAKLDGEIKCAVNYSDRRQIAEVVDMKWVGMDEAKYMGRLLNTMRAVAKGE